MVRHLKEGKNNMKKILLIIIGLLILTGCSLFELSEEDKAKAKEYEEQAKEIATNHIFTKYGFNAVVKEAKAETNRDSIGPLYLTGDVYVTMEYNNRIFYVKVPVSNEYEHDTKDTYQNDVIEKKIKSELESIFNTKLLYFDSYLNNNKPRGAVYYADYYNGTGIENFIPSFKAGVLNAEELDSNNENRLKKLIAKQDVKIYNFKSESEYKKIPKNEHKLFGTPEAIYIKEKYEEQSGLDNLYHYTVNIKEDDIIVGYESVKDKTINSISNYEIKKLDSSILDEMFKYYKRKPNIVINSISLGTNDTNFVYVSKDYYNKHKNLGAVYYCKSKNYNMNEVFKPYGDYYYVHFSNYGECDDNYIVFIN